MSFISTLAQDKRDKDSIHTQFGNNEVSEYFQFFFDELNLQDRGTRVKTRDTSTDTIWGLGVWGTDDWDGTYDNPLVTQRVVHPNRQYLESFNSTFFKDTTGTATWTGSGVVSFTGSQYAKSDIIYKNNETVSSATLSADYNGSVDFFLSATDSSLIAGTFSSVPTRNGINGTSFEGINNNIGAISDSSFATQYMTAIFDVKPTKATYSQTGQTYQIETYKLLGTTLTDSGRVVVDCNPGLGVNYVASIPVTLPSPGWYYTDVYYRNTASTSVAKFVGEFWNGATLEASWTQSSNFTSYSNTFQYIKLTSSAGTSLDFKIKYLDNTNVRLDSVIVWLNRDPVIGRDSAWGFTLADTGYRFQTTNSAGTSVSNWYTSGSPLISDAGSYQRIAISYDGSFSKIYKNGVFLQSSSATLPLSTSSGNLRMGNHSFWVFTYGQFDLKNISIYNRALTDAEILSDSSGISITDGRIIRMPLNEISSQFYSQNNWDYVINEQTTTLNQSGTDLRWLAYNVGTSSASIDSMEVVY